MRLEASDHFRVAEQHVGNRDAGFLAQVETVEDGRRLLRQPGDSQRAAVDQNHHRGPGTINRHRPGKKPTRSRCQNPTALTGTGLSVVVPLPSSPWCLSPQH